MCICPVCKILPHFSLKPLKTTEFLKADGNEFKTLEALYWKVPDFEKSTRLRKYLILARNNFSNVVSFEDLSVRVCRIMMSSLR